MLDVICAYFAAVCVLRVKSCNLHTNVLCHLFYSVVYNICLNVKKNTDSAACMNIGRNETVLLCNLFETTDAHVLTDDGDFRRKSFLNSKALICCPLLVHKCVHICRCCCKSLSCYLSNVCLELSVLSNEVCLSVNLNDNSFLLVCCHSCVNDTLSCDTSSFLLSACKSFFS